jgi:DNA-binding NarL/FixJ family response regulator
MATAAAAIIYVPTASGLRTVPRRIRVLTVDGHQLIQEGLAAMIDREDDMTVVAMASSGEEAIDDVRRYRPDVVTLDLLLPDMRGEDLARRILAEFPQTRIVAITSVRDHMHIRRALDAGVHGYLSKAVPVCELIRAIRHLEGGERIIPGPVACEFAGHVTGEPLTKREVQVLQLAAWGSSNKQIASQLSIAGETVRLHIRNILQKLAANDRTHAVTIALTRRILLLDTNASEVHGRTAYA